MFLSKNQTPMQVEESTAKTMLTLTKNWKVQNKIKPPPFVSTTKTEVNIEFRQ